MNKCMNPELSKLSLTWHRVVNLFCFSFSLSLFHCLSLLCMDSSLAGLVCVIFVFDKILFSDYLPAYPHTVLPASRHLNIYVFMYL